MVFLSRIYTKTGDDGFTGLGDGTRVSKDSARVAAYGAVGDPKGEARMGEAYVQRLEGWIDGANSDLPDLTSFILPGGTKGAAWLHLARTVCRRAERSVVTLFADPEEAAQSNPQVLLYLNRLSDLLFVLARYVNHAAGEGDVLWRPAGKVEES